MKFNFNWRRRFARINHYVGSFGARPRYPERPVFGVLPSINGLWDTGGGFALCFAAKAAEGARPK